MSDKPGSITLLQLTRFGDILQTIWAVKDIKATNPDLSINLIVRKKLEINTLEEEIIIMLHVFLCL